MEFYQSMTISAEHQLPTMLKVDKWIVDEGEVELQDLQAGLLHRCCIKKLANILHVPQGFSMYISIVCDSDDLKSTYRHL